MRVAVKDLKPGTEIRFGGSEGTVITTVAHPEFEEIWFVLLRGYPSPSVLTLDADYMVEIGGVEYL